MDIFSPARSLILRPVSEEGHIDVVDDDIKIIRLPPGQGERQLNI